MFFCFCFCFVSVIYPCLVHGEKKWVGEILNQNVTLYQKK